MGSVMSVPCALWFIANLLFASFNLAAIVESYQQYVVGLQQYGEALAIWQYTGTLLIREIMMGSSGITSGIEIRENC